MPSPTDTGLEPAGRPSRRLWAGALVYLPPLVLTIVATTQIVLSKQSTLAPWKGGGFGMFSSVDLEGYRIARAFVTVENGQEYAIQLGDMDEFELSVLRAKAFPTERRLGALADQMLRTNWRSTVSERIVSRSSRGSREPRLRATAIRLEILRIVFDRESRRMSRMLLAETTRERP